MEQATIRQGDTLVYAARPGYLDASESIPATCICMAGLYTSSGSEVVAAKQYATKQTIGTDEYFVVYLTRQETAGLSEEVYEFAVDMRDDTTTPPYSDESPVAVVVEGQRIAVA